MYKKAILYLQNVVNNIVNEILWQSILTDVGQTCMLKDLLNSKTSSIIEFKSAPPMTPMTSYSSPATSLTVLDVLMKSFALVIKRLDVIEARQVAASLAPSLPAPAHKSPPAVPTCTWSGLQEPACEAAEVQGASSWAGVAMSGNYPALVATASRKPIRVGSKQTDRCQVKMVPWLLACFVGRLDPSTMEEELSAHLMAEGMKVLSVGSLYRRMVRSSEPVLSRLPVV